MAGLSRLTKRVRSLEDLYEAGERYEEERRRKEEEAIQAEVFRRMDVPELDALTAAMDSRISLLDQAIAEGRVEISEEETSEEDRAIWRRYEQLVQEVRAEQTHAS